MSQTVGELLAFTLAEIGARQVFGIVGDALNPFTDAIRREKRIAWFGVRHEEGAALAAAGQAKLTGRLGVCAGTTGLRRQDDSRPWLCCIRRTGRSSDLVKRWSRSGGHRRLSRAPAAGVTRDQFADERREPRH